jgi:predicted permease
LFGVVPVIRASVPDVSRLLNAAGRGNVQGGFRSRLRQLLVVGEIALALVALTGAGLFIRSLRNVQSFNLGFDADNLVVGNLNVAALQMTPEAGMEFVKALIAKVRAVPGVTAVALRDSPPVRVGLVQTVFREGDPTDSRIGMFAPTPPITPDYFSTMKVPLVDGRLFNEFDRADSTRVAIISEAFARHLWPGQRAIGRRFHFATSNNLIEVVGVVRNHTVQTIGEAPQPTAWLPFEQAYQPFSVLHVRTASAPEKMIPAIADAVQSMNSNLLFVNPGTARQVIFQALWAPRMAATLFGIFGFLGLALAVIGVYGVLAYTVVQRTSEIGLRMAVGAKPVSVVGMVLGQSASMAALGIAIGLGVAIALTRTVANLLYNLQSDDPLTFVSVALILAATALLAGGIPAWRASRIDPVIALRQE